MKTRIINCAKVTRPDWDDWTDDQSGRAPSVFQKIKALIKKHAPKGQHELISVKDSPPKFKTTGDKIDPAKQSRSSLDRKIAELRKKGRKVLDFWREDDRWQIKVMA